MLEAGPNGTSKTEFGVIGRLNNGIWNRLSQALPPHLREQTDFSIKSFRAREIVFPKNCKRALETHDIKGLVVDKLSEAVEDIYCRTEDECILGSKVLSNTTFKELLSREARKQQLLNSDSQEVLDYWINNWDTIPEDKPKYKKILDAIVTPFKELTLTGRLTSIALGNVLSRCEGVLKIGQVDLSSPVRKVGEFLTKVPIQMQVAEDVQGAISICKDDTEKQKMVTNIASRYGIDYQELAAVSHPDFLNVMKKSLALNVTIYTLPRLILGYSAFAALLSSPEFRNYVTTANVETLGVSASVLFAGALARQRIDYAVLRDRGLSPDAIETFFALFNGRINDKLKLKANSRWGLMGAPLDLAVSSFAPMYAWAWAVDVPYSISAYLLAMYVDQVAFATTNVFWGTSVKIKEKFAQK